MSTTVLFSVLMAQEELRLEGKVGLSNRRNLKNTAYLYMTFPFVFLLLLIRNSSSTLFFYFLFYKFFLYIYSFSSDFLSLLTRNSPKEIATEKNNKSNIKILFTFMFTWGLSALSSINGSTFLRLNIE